MTEIPVKHIEKVLFKDIERSTSVSRSLSRISSDSSSSSQRSYQDSTGKQKHSSRCGICFEKYNLSEKLPRIACERNHILCEACIRKIVQTDKLLCPFCKAKLGNGKFKLPIQMQIIGRLQMRHSMGVSAANSGFNQIRSSRTVGNSQIRDDKQQITSLSQPNVDIIQVLSELREDEVTSEDISNVFLKLKFSDQKQIRCCLELAKPSYQLVEQTTDVLLDISRQQSKISLNNILKQCLLKGPELAEAVVSISKKTEVQQIDHTMSIEYIGRFRYQVGGEFDQLYSFLVSVEFLLQELQAQQLVLQEVQKQEQYPDETSYKKSIQCTCICLWSLGNLALNNQWLRSFILDQGVIKPILDSLDLNVQAVQVQAVKALWYLLDRNSRIQKSFVQGGLIKPLVKSLTSDNVTIRSFAISLKYQLLRNDHVNEEQLDIFTIDQILKLIEVPDIDQSHKCQLLKQLSEITAKNNYNVVYIKSQNGVELLQTISKNKKEGQENKDLATYILTHLNYGQKRKSVNLDKMKRIKIRVKKFVLSKLLAKMQLLHN